MKTLSFESLFDATVHFDDMYHELTLADNLNMLSIISKYDTAKELIETLVYLGFHIRDLEIEPSDSNNYDKEYVIEIYKNTISCTKCSVNGKYKNIESDMVFIFGDCSSKIIPNIHSELVYEVNIEEKKSKSYIINGKKVSEDKYMESVNKLYDEIDTIFTTFEDFWF